MNSTTYLKAFVLMCFPLTIFISCRKMLEIPPPVNSLSDENVFSSDETAIASVSGFYASMSKLSGTSGGFVGQNSVSALTGLSSDELLYFNLQTITRYRAINFNDLDPYENDWGSEFWRPLYNYIFRCNSAIEGLTSSQADNLTPLIRQYLIGEVKFLRAFYYFYLVNMFGDVPLALTTDYVKNALLSRSSKAEVYDQIIIDLNQAVNLLPDNFKSANMITASVERVRPTKWSAIALRARVYLYMGKFSDAEEQASALINNSNLFSLPALNNVFKKNSREAIWQLQPTTTYFNTEDARLFVVPATGLNTANPFRLSEQLLNAFEFGDQRKSYGNWVDSSIHTVSTVPLVHDTIFYPYKYKLLVDSSITGSNALNNMGEYQMVLRLAEQYLIRAEARAMQNNISGARQDLLAIRDRALLPQSTLTANDQASLLTAILHERQVELFTEWGHRWFDLKRNGKVDDVMSIATPIKSKGLNQWKSYQQLYPIPFTEIQQAPNLVQNLGY